MIKFFVKHAVNNGKFARERGRRTKSRIVMEETARYRFLAPIIIIYECSVRRI